MLSQNEPCFSRLFAPIYGCPGGWSSPDDAIRTRDKKTHTQASVLRRTIRFRTIEAFGKPLSHQKMHPSIRPHHGQPKFFRKHLTTCQLRLNPTEGRVRVSLPDRVRKDVVCRNSVATTDHSTN